MTEDGAHESPPFSCNRKAIIGLACSGGGSRAAYLTAAVLKEIRRANVGLTMQGNLAGSGNLLEEISLISSVSGGSVAAAYYALNKEDLGADSEQRAWKTYLAKMALNHRQWWRFVYNPLIWAQFLLTNYNRGHWARGYYDRVLFCRKSLHELPNYPALYINAVDVMTEERFVFSKNTIHLSIQEDSPSLTHDLASSWVDPRSVRISDAVYASSAFPFVYPNLPLYNYAFNPPSIRFLADGGIFDNSGLLTLMVEMERAFSLSHNRCFILAICIDAENQWKENRLEV
ncbi:MAG: patatin-like phospholipase family protein, partial [Nitrospira sp.]|nr:patatin-like phospholipase family protein [Nitrospira sp.]